MVVVVVVVVVVDVTVVTVVLVNALVVSVVLGTPLLVVRGGMVVVLETVEWNKMLQVLLAGLSSASMLLPPLIYFLPLSCFHIYYHLSSV